MALTRTFKGLVLLDTMARANSALVGNGWDETIIGDGTQQILGNKCDRPAGGAGSFGAIYRDDVVIPADAIYQVNSGFLAANSTIFLNLRVSGKDDGFGSENRYSTQIRRDTQEHRIDIVKLGVNVNPVNNGFDPNINPHALRFITEVSGSNLILRSKISQQLIDEFDLTQPFTKDEISFTDTSPIPLVPNNLDIYFLQQNRGSATHVILMGRNVTVDGLPNGWKAKLGSEPAIVEVSGTATIDVDRVALPQTTLQILDGSDILQEQIVLTDDIWGGDTYSLAPVGVCFLPIYRYTVFKLRSQDPTETVAMTPDPPNIHSDDFKVASATGVTGFQPYMARQPRGRRGTLDVLKASTSTGRMTIENLDKRIFDTASQTFKNAERWFTAFVGDDNGRDMLRGAKVFVEESLDGGISYTGFYTGRISGWRIEEHLGFILTLRDLADDLDRDVFVGRPEGSVAYAQMSNVLPLGLEDDYGFFQSTPRLAGQYDDGADPFRIMTVADTSRNNPKNIVTKALVDSGNETVSFGGLAAFDSVENIRVTFRSLLIVGEFDLREFGARRRGTKQLRVDAFSIEELDASDPDFLAFPVGNRTAFWSFVWNGPLSKSTPLMIGDVHPAQLFRDLLDGKFSRLNTDGTVTWSFPYDAALFTALIADTTFGAMRIQIDDEDTLSDFVEKIIGQGFGIGYRINPDGILEPFDLRIPSVALSVPTLTNDELVESTIPSWDNSSKAVTKVRANWFLESEINPQTILDSDDNIPDIPTCLIREQETLIDVISFDALFDVGESRYKLPADGYRGHRLEIDDRGSSVTVKPLNIEKRADEILTQWERGSGKINFRLRRVSGITGANLLLPGDFRILDFDTIPDYLSNMRGGPRLVICTSREDDGPEVVIECLDTGVNIPAAVPTWVSWVLETGNTSHGVVATLNENVVGNRIELGYAITDTSVGTRPSELSPLWVYGRRMRRGSPTTRILRSLPAGKRIWGRARSISGFGVTNGKQQPSPYVFPSDGSPAGSRDTVALGTPTGLATSLITAKTARLSWTPADSTSQVRVLLSLSSPAVDQRIDLPPGSSQFDLGSLDASTTYFWSVQHIGSGGTIATAATTVSFATIAGATAAPTMGAPIIIVGRDTTFDDPEITPLEALIGVYARAQISDATLDFEIQSTTDSGGTPDLGALQDEHLEQAGTVNFIVEFPADGALRYLRTRHRGGGFDPGPWSDFSLGFRPEIISQSLIDASAPTGSSGVGTSESQFLIAPVGTDMWAPI